MLNKDTRLGTTCFTSQEWIRRYYFVKARRIHDGSHVTHTRKKWMEKNKPLATVGVVQPQPTDESRVVAEVARHVVCGGLGEGSCSWNSRSLWAGQDIGTSRT